MYITICHLPDTTLAFSYQELEVTPHLRPLTFGQGGTTPLVFIVPVLMRFSDSPVCNTLVIVS